MKAAYGLLYNFNNQKHDSTTGYLPSVPEYKKDMHEISRQVGDSDGNKSSDDWYVIRR